MSGTTTVLLAVGTLTWAKPDDGHVVVLAGGLVAILSLLELEAGPDHAAAGRRGASPLAFAVLGPAGRASGRRALYA